MKKLTAGIFTALLGLVTVNAANAAIPSTNYVDTKIGAVETAYQAADTALGNRITTNANAIGTLTDLTTTATDNTVAAINEVNKAYKDADTALLNNKIGTDTMGAIQTGTDTSVTPTTLTEAVNALNTKIDHKTNGIATNAELGALQTTVSGHTTDISGLQGRMTTAEGDIVNLKAADTELDTAIKANTQAITDNVNILALKANTADLGTLAAKNSVETSDLDSTLQAAVGQVATNKSNIESLSATVDAKASQADLDTAESAIAENAAAILLKASQTDLDTTNTNVTNLTGRVDTAESDIDALETKTEGLKSLAYQDIIDNSDITDGTIAQAKITDLTTDLAAKVDDSQVIAAAGTVTNADAEIPTIARMNAALAGKMPLTTTDTVGEDGTYVLTATTAGGTTTYKWELIERNTTSSASEGGEA